MTDLVKLASPSDDLIAVAVTETFGERCSTYDADCYTCQAWAQYDRRLAEAGTQAEPVAWQWCCFEDGEQRTGWQHERHGDQKGWEKLVESNPTKYRIVKRPLFTTQPAPSVAVPSPPQDDVRAYAERLAIALWEKHYKDSAPDWKPLTGDLMGLLTQIDNMTAALAAANQSDGGGKLVPPVATVGMDWQLSDDAQQRLAEIDRAIVRPGDPRLNQIFGGPSDISPAPQAVEAVNVSDLLHVIALWSDDEGLDLSMGQGEALARALLAKFKMEER